MKKRSKLNLLEYKKFLIIKAKNFFLEYKRYFKIKSNNILFSSNSKKIVKNSTKSFYYTCLSSLVIITFFYFSPMLVNFYNTLLQNNKEIKNESKINLDKVLSGKSIEKEEKNDIDTYQVFEDIFEF